MGKKQDTAVISRLENTMSESSELQFVKLMIEDPKTYEAYRKALKPDYFNNGGVREIIKIMNTFYEEKQFPACYEDIKYQTERLAKSPQIIDNVRWAYKQMREMTLEGSVSLMEYGLDYIKKKAIADVCNKMVSDFDTKPYSDLSVEGAVKDIVEIAKATNEEDRVVSGNELINMMCEFEVDARILLGIKELDDHVGGLPKKTVNMLIAPTGVGKTTFLSICAFNAAMQGYNVLHFFFEDTNADIGAKYFADVFMENTNTYLHDRNKMVDLMNNPDNADFKDALLNNIKQIKLKVGESSVDDVKMKIIESINRGFTPDFVVLDYMGCLKLTSNKIKALENEWQLLERETKKLEAMSHDFNVCILTAQQTNRDGSKEDTANNRIGNVQGSFRMLQPCSYVFYLTKENGDGDYNRASLYLDKSRGCPKKAWEKIYFNNGTCQIDLSGAVQYNDRLAFEE